MQLSNISSGVREKFLPVRENKEDDVEKGAMEQIILFIDDNPVDPKQIKKAFKSHRDVSHIQFVDSAKSGLDIIQKKPVKAVFIKEKLPDMDAFAFIKQLKKRGMQVPVVLIVEDHDETAVSRAIKKGAQDCVMRSEKNFHAYPFVIDRAIARYELDMERAERERLISESQKVWMAVIDGIGDYILIIDRESKIFRTNNALSRAFNKHPKEIIGMDIVELFGKDAAYMFQEMSEDGIPKTEEKTVNNDAYMISSFPLSYNDQQMTIYVMKNLSETKRLKEQLYHSYKLASLGLLISGIAHEINNPIAGIITYTELLKMKVHDQQIEGGLQKILTGAERCKKVIQNLLTFSRQRTPSKTLESINDIIDRTIELRSYWLRKYHIEVIKEYGEIPFILVDSQQLQLVVLNILMNAEQALEGKEGADGRLIFATGYDPEKHKITIKISDNGPGIPQNTISRIFDPFFTTKPVGTGTGLGLSIAHGIIAEHGGTIRAESRTGEGAAFVIELPHEKHNKENIQIIR
jgi:signal transduction histidine kinase